jgi:hypothetical protein
MIKQLIACEAGYPSDKVREKRITTSSSLSWRECRDYIRTEMMRQDSEGFTSREHAVLGLVKFSAQTLFNGYRSASVVR